MLGGDVSCLFPELHTSEAEDISRQKPHKQERERDSKAKAGSHDPKDVRDVQRFHAWLAEIIQEHQRSP